MFSQQELSQRVKDEAMYIVENRVTIRRTAKKFGISKTTVHKDVTDRLKEIDGKLYNKVRKILDYNITQRAIRGGMATRKKYKKYPKK